MIEGGADHVQVRDEDGLADIGGEVVFVFVYAAPHARLGLAQRFGVELVEVEARLDAIVKLKRLEPAH